MYLKVAKQVDFKGSYHKKKNLHLCEVMEVTRLVVMTTSQYVPISNHYIVHLEYNVICQFSLALQLYQGLVSRQELWTEKVFDFSTTGDETLLGIWGVYLVILLLMGACHKPPSTSFLAMETSNTIGYSGFMACLTIVYTCGKIFICLWSCLI